MEDAASELSEVPATARTSSLAIDSTGRIPLVPGDAEGLYTITGLGSVTQELELFREQIAQHVSYVTVSLETADQQLKDLFTAVTASHEKIKSTGNAAAAATKSADAASMEVEALTVRLKKAEAALDVLPAWKAAYEARGKAAEEAAKAREREAAARCDRLEALVDALQTRMGQRFESLEDLVMKGAESRARQADDILKLKSDSAACRDGLAAADTSLRSLTATASTHSRKLEAAASEALHTGAQIKHLQEQTNEVLNTTGDLTSTTQQLATTTDITSSGLDVMRSDFEEAERATRILTERVVVLEADTRADDALEATKDIAELAEDVGRVQKELDECMADLEARIEQVAEVAEAGPTSLRDLVETSEELKVSTKAAHDQITKLDSRLAAAKAAMDAQASLGEAAMAAAGDAGRAAAAVGTRMDSESKRLTAYCDRSIQPLARCAQLDEVREQIVALKAVVADGAAHTKEEVKFELMHEKSPQVSTLKDFLAQQERNTARLSERLTLAEEKAALARADAAESYAALSTLRAENTSQQEGGSELRGQVTALMTRMHEIQGLADAAQQEAQAARHAVDVAAAKDVTLSRAQVSEIVNLAATTARRGAHPSWALHPADRSQHGSPSPGSECGDEDTARDGGTTLGHGAEARGDLHGLQPSFLDAESSQLRPGSSMRSDRRGSRAGDLLALRATTSGAESVWGAPDAHARHACVSQEHAALAKDMATSLLEVHKKSNCAQAFNEYVQLVENEYSTSKPHKEHCKLMKGVNTVLDRLTRKRASHAADFTVTTVAVHDMRLCLLERVMAQLQETVTHTAKAASCATKVADSAILEASGKVPATLGNEMLAGMHALVRVLGEALVAGLSHEGLASMKQIVENKVHAYVSTHGPKLREISEHAILNGRGGASLSERPVSSPPHGTKITQKYRRGASAPSDGRGGFGPSRMSASVHKPHARIPGQIVSVEEETRAHDGVREPVPARPYTAGPAVQSTPIKHPADTLMQTLADSTASQRRVRSAHPRAARVNHTATAPAGRLSPAEFYQTGQSEHPGAPGVPSVRPSAAVNASFYKARRDLPAQHQHPRQSHPQSIHQGSSRSNASRGEGVRWSVSEGLLETLDISPIQPGAHDKVP